MSTVDLRDRLHEAGFLPPDPSDRTLVNLMASVIRSRGGESPHPGFAGLDEEALAACRSLVLVLVDGLGWHQVEAAQRERPAPAFIHRRSLRATTVFPATTAVATTTLTTGASPAEHGVLGWYTHLPEIGLNTTILLGTTRLGMPVAPETYPWRELLRIPCPADTMTQPRTFIAPDRIPWSPFSMACAHWDHRIGRDTWEEMEASIIRFASSPGPGFAYAYWPAYDTACHEHGVSSPEAAAERVRADAGLARLHDRLANRGVGLIVTADHGLVDTRPLDPVRHPGWLATQATLPAGDARHLACFVRSGREAAFLDLTREVFGDRALLVPGEELAAAGLFGPGPEHPAFRARLGDWFILLRDGWHCELSIPGREPSGLIGTHGGMSPEEMEVPVFLAGALAG